MLLLDAVVTFRGEKSKNWGKAFLEIGLTLQSSLGSLIAGNKNGFNGRLRFQL